LSLTSNSWYDLTGLGFSLKPASPSVLQEILAQDNLGEPDATGVAAAFYMHTLKSDGRVITDNSAIKVLKMP